MVLETMDSKVWSHATNIVDLQLSLCLTEKWVTVSELQFLCELWFCLVDKSLCKIIRQARIRASLALLYGFPLFDEVVFEQCYQDNSILYSQQFFYLFSAKSEAQDWSFCFWALKSHYYLSHV